LKNPSDARTITTPVRLLQQQIGRNTFIQEMDKKKVQKLWSITAKCNTEKLK
jgi:hypothetical protein